MEDIFDLVNERDEVIGHAPRSEVHARGLLHRAVHIWIFNSKGECLFQMRSPRKDRFPNTWTSSVSGHVDHGETYLEAAQREIREEVGLKKAVALEEVAYVKACSQTEQEFVRLYMLRHDGPFFAQPDEVATLEWFTPTAIMERMKTSPVEFSPSIVYLWNLHGVQAMKLLDV